LGFLGDQTANLEKAQKNYPEIFQISSNNVGMLQQKSRTSRTTSAQAAFIRGGGCSAPHEPPFFTRNLEMFTPLRLSKSNHFACRPVNQQLPITSHHQRRTDGEPFWRTSLME
jgi:hypothetical protein